MKKLYLLSLFALFSIFAQAQVSVTATLGTPGPSSYATLEEAVSAINNGVHQGDITVSITDNTSETLPSTFVQSGTGAASYSTIAIRPATGVAPYLAGNIAGALLLSLIPI